MLERTRPSSTRAARRVGLLVVLAAFQAAAQVVVLDARTTAFVEPSSQSKLTVLTPALDLAVNPTDWLSVSAGYEADIVTGATESVKAGPLVDVVTSATSFSDQRHVAHGGFRITRKGTHLGASYAYGTESDYRSNAITVSAGTDFLQKNTQIELSYARGFDRVCTTAYASTLAPSARAALDSSEGCFTDAEDRTARDIDLDNYQVGWTQTWTPVLATQLVATGALQHGFLENPYRSVVITPTGLEALENHPDNRFRAAMALRAKYYLRPIKTAFGAGVRGYRDTWDLLSMTYELDAERYLLPWLRVLARGRFYSQTGALFWSDDYTGGEPELGPRGQYWTGDRELSPLKSYLVGGRILASWNGRPGDRVLGALLKLSAGFSMDVVKTNLEEFTWSGRQPDDTWVFLGSLGASGEF